MEQPLFGFIGELTSSPEERPARMSPSPGSAPGCRKEAERAPASRSTSCGLPESCDPDGCFGKTWREVSIPRTPPTSSALSVRLGTAGILSRGGCWTRSMCEWTGWSVPSRRDAGVCGLSDVLEPMSPSLRKYFLSPTALKGILRRADARGKALATPPRNCDMGTAEEQSERMAEFCREQYKKTDGVALCSGCRFHYMDGLECQFAWAQMPYESEVKV